MPDARHFLRRPASEKWLLLGALLEVIKARVVLWVVPYRFWRRQVIERSRNEPAGPAADAHRADAQQIAGAVARVSRHVPGASCLTQALAARKMLRRRGIETTLRLGVARDVEGGFRAHAWIEHAGDVLLGDRGIDLKEFVPLTDQPPAK